jgi:hypothetical protein
MLAKTLAFVVLAAVLAASLTLAGSPRVVPGAAVQNANATWYTRYRCEKYGCPIGSCTGLPKPTGVCLLSDGSGSTLATCLHDKISVQVWAISNRCEGAPTTTVTHELNVCAQWEVGVYYDYTYNVCN